MREFQQLNVWRRAHDLVLRIYVESKVLPASENFGLTMNLRRTVIAIPRSIAQGCAHESEQEFASDLRKARAASLELEYLLLLCRDLGFFPPTLHEELRDENAEVGKMLSGLLKRMTTPAGPVR